MPAASAADVEASFDGGFHCAVTVASDTWLQIRDECRGRSRGPITLKGKGDVELIEVVSA